MTKSILRSGIVIALLLMLPAVSSPSGEMKMSVPVALKNVMTEVVQLFVRKHPEFDIKLAYNNPKEQERLVSLGLPVDIIVMPEKLTLDKMEKDGLLVPGSITKLLSNGVTVVANVDNDFVIKDIKDLVTDPMQKFSICSDTVRFCKNVHDYLTNLGLPADVGDRMVLKGTQREAVEAVKSGEAMWTFCYASEVAQSKKLRPIWYVQDPSLNAITYYAAIVAKSSNVEGARELFAIQDTSIAQMIYQNTGLLTRAAPAPQNPPPPPLYHETTTTATTEQTVAKEDKGETEEKQAKEERAEKGEKGEKGERGEKGEKGEKEKKGEKGEKGEKGGAQTQPQTQTQTQPETQTQTQPQTQTEPQTQTQTQPDTQSPP